MTIQVIGAGLGRTGTKSLKAALERLLGGTCHHMAEVFEHFDDEVDGWHQAALGNPPDWHEFLSRYNAIVDWPGCSFWPELTEAFPDALVLVSIRDLDEWFTSASNTIFRPSKAMDDSNPFSDMWSAICEHRFTPDYRDRDAATEAAARHYAAVLAGVDRSRLLIWSPGDGWGPICERLGVPVPNEPFPHTNTTAEFRKQYASDE